VRLLPQVPLTSLQGTLILTDQYTVLTCYYVNGVDALWLNGFTAYLTGSEGVASISSLEVLDMTGCERLDCEAMRKLSALGQLRSFKLSGCVYMKAEGLGHLARGCPLLIR
jgi:hypothetical protein